MKDKACGQSREPWKTVDGILATECAREMEGGQKQQGDWGEEVFVGRWLNPSSNWGSLPGITDSFIQPYFPFILKSCIHFLFNPSTNPTDILINHSSSSAKSLL